MKEEIYHVEKNVRFVDTTPPTTNNQTTPHPPQKKINKAKGWMGRLIYLLYSNF